MVNAEDSEPLKSINLTVDSEAEESSETKINYKDGNNNYQAVLNPDGTTATWSLSTNDVTSMAIDETGYAYFLGMKEGTYYLKETAYIRRSATDCRSRSIPHCFQKKESKE